MNSDKLTITLNCFFSVPIILVGNKSDLQSDRRVTSDEGKNLAAEMKAVFLETSAKENQVNTVEWNTLETYVLRLVKCGHVMY